MSEPFRRGVGLAAFALCLLCPLIARADVTVTLADGRATVVARNATLRQVLAEWARVGGTRIVNLERVPGPPDTFELRNMPEAKALAALLRSVAGYIAAPRRADSRGASIYDRILILPTSVAGPAMGPLRAAAPPPAPVYEPPPDPSALANEDPNENAGIAAPPVYQGNGTQEAPQPAGPPPPMTTPGVTPYSPNPADPASALPGQPTAPPAQPNAGQFVTPQPGVLPPPTQTPQQQPKP